MTPDRDTRRMLIVDNDDVDFARRTAAEHDVALQRVEMRGLEPVLTTTLLLFGAAAAVGLVTSLVDRHRGGQIIDLRPGTPRPVYRSKDVIFGLVVIFARDGRVTVEVKEPAGMFGQVLEALTALLGELAGAGVADIAPAVTEKVGDAARISTESTGSQ
ncbi:hypothetical protein AB0M54_15105 [Actinoplanes sp. NPDC051470]|uniref:hypothetical protein n=1 Tax=unclassified Actinoplanes TaxID=2626549 RepID=UPI0034407005